MFEKDKMAAELNKFLSQQNVKSKSDMEKALQLFMTQYNAKIAAPGAKDAEPEDVYDYLELAGKATNSKDRQKCLRQALKLDPDNLDAARMLIKEKYTTLPAVLEKMEELRQKADAKMEEDGTFEEDTGHFWGVSETRPYMRLIYEIMQIYIALGSMRRAAAIGERILELNRNDNMGARSDLLCIYALLEEKTKAEKVMKRFKGTTEGYVLLPLCVLYYKLGDLKKAQDTLERIADVNPDTEKVMAAMDAEGPWRNLEKLLAHPSPYGIRANSAEELADVIYNNHYLFGDIPTFYGWALDILAKSKRKKK